MKDRPAAIIAAVASDAVGDTRVLVLPITHSAPARGIAALEIPAALKRNLGLDAERSWIVLAEWNEFVWPGPDLRPIRNDLSSIAYGSLSRGFFAKLRDEFVAAVTAGRAKQVTGSE